MTFAEEMLRDADLLRRRFVFATRKRGPLTLDEALVECYRMADDDRAGRQMPDVEPDPAGDEYEGETAIEGGATDAYVIDVPDNPDDWEEYDEGEGHDDEGDD
jgi:hypothetical protein